MHSRFTILDKVSGRRFGQNAKGIVFALFEIVSLKTVSVIPRAF